MSVSLSPEVLEQLFQGEIWKGLEMYANENIAARTKTLKGIDPIKSIEIAKLQEEIRQHEKLKEIHGALEQYILKRSSP